jgi:hypothetical protein
VSDGEGRGGEKWRGKVEADSDIDVCLSGHGRAGLGGDDRGSGDECWSVSLFAERLLDDDDLLPLPSALA